ncbi:MAG TPA: type 4a pilus biogenesis protein PilO [Actinomycetota bacterium]|jgi:Tfp pilus assembly protein PilO|nr:type 4a pilus biogenesis protein PilO [Actinomycetota bacterium]
MNRRAPVFAAIAVALVAIAATMLLVFPKYREVGRAKEQLKSAQDEQLVLETELARLQEAKKHAPQLMRQLAKVRREIPPASDLPGLINHLQDAADISQVDFFSVAPQVPVVTGQASEIPAQVQVIGSFFSVDHFLWKLETLPRAAKVLGVQVAEGPDQLPQIQVTLQVEFFTTDTTTGPGAAVPSKAGPAPAASPSPAANATEGV